MSVKIGRTIDQEYADKRSSVKRFRDIENEAKLLRQKEERLLKKVKTERDIVITSRADAEKQQVLRNVESAIKSILSKVNTKTSSYRREARKYDNQLPNLSLKQLKVSIHISLQSLQLVIMCVCVCDRLIIGWRSQKRRLLSMHCANLFLI